MIGFVSDPHAAEAPLPSSVQVPQHVVYRHFAAETVVLNLQTGKYHGLNRTAGRMLELLDAESALDETATKLSNEYRRPREQVLGDLEAFCRDLLARKLIEPKPPRA